MTTRSLQLALRGGLPLPLVLAIAVAAPAAAAPVGGPGWVPAGAYPGKITYEISNSARSAGGTAPSCGR